MKPRAGTHQRTLGLFVVAGMIGACGVDAVHRGEPLPPNILDYESGPPRAATTRTLSTLHETPDRKHFAPSRSNHAAAAAADTLRELALLSELVEMLSVSDATALELEDKLDAYDGWVLRNRIAPPAAAGALESAVHHGKLVAPRGTRPARREEVITILGAIAADVDETREVVQHLEATLLRLENLQQMATSLVERVREMERNHDAKPRTPGLHRARSADVYRAMELEAGLLARVDHARALVRASAIEGWDALARVDTAITRLAEGVSIRGE